MAEMYGSYSDEDLNEWERMPQNIRVLTSSAFGAWLLRRDKRMKEQEPKTGHWSIVSDGYGDSAYICECSECKDTVWVYKDADHKWNYCPNCGAIMIEVSE